MNDERLEANAESIREVPSRLMDENTRDWLASRAWRGEDIYVYHSGLGDAGVWNLWLGGTRFQLAGVQNGRTMMFPI